MSIWAIISIGILIAMAILAGVGLAFGCIGCIGAATLKSIS